MFADKVPKMQNKYLNTLEMAIGIMMITTSGRLDLLRPQGVGICFAQKRIAACFASPSAFGMAVPACAFIPKASFIVKVAKPLDEVPLS